MLNESKLKTIGSLAIEYVWIEGVCVRIPSLSDTDRMANGYNGFGCRLGMKDMLGF